MLTEWNLHQTIAVWVINSVFAFLEFFLFQSALTSELFSKFFLKTFFITIVNQQDTFFSDIW